MLIVFSITIIFILLIIVILILYKNREYFKNTDFNIYLISLEKDVERREKILKYIEPDIIFSVDGSTLDRELLIKNGKLDTNSKLKLGEIGCYLSHINLIDKSLNSEKYTIIFEDDVKIESDTINKISKIINDAPKDFQILCLGYNYYEEYSEFSEIKYLFGSQAYVINPRNINRDDLKKFFPINEPYDIVLPRNLKTYIVIPKLVELQENSISNTQGIN